MRYSHLWVVIASLLALAWATGGVLLGSHCKSRAWSFPHGEGLVGTEMDHVMGRCGDLKGSGGGRWTMGACVAEGGVATSKGWLGGGLMEVVPPGVRANCPKPFPSSFQGNATQEMKTWATVSAAPLASTETPGSHTAAGHVPAAMAKAAQWCRAARRSSVTTALLELPVMPFYRSLLLCLSPELLPAVQGDAGIGRPGCSVGWIISSSQPSLPTALLLLPVMG